MMPGVAAQPLGRRPAGDTSLASANFRTGVYAVAGVPVALADIIDQPELVGATGLAIPELGNTVAILGDFLALLLTANWTAVIEWNHFGSRTNINPMVVSGPDDDTINLRRQDSTGTNYMMVSDYAGVNYRQAVDASAPIGEGIHKIAVTRTDSKLVFSIDGRPFVSDSYGPMTFSLSPTGAALGGYPDDTVGDALTIRSIKVFSPVPDSQLSLLSTHVPSVASWSLDFLGGTYTANGTAVALADQIDKPERVGVSGLEILDNDVDGVVSARADLLTDYAIMTWTTVIEWDEQTTDGATYLLYLADDEDNHSLVIERSTAFAGLRVDVHEGSFNTRHVEIDTEHGPGIHKIAVTRTDSRISLSCDGSAVVTLAVAPIDMNPMVVAAFGGDPYDQSYNGTFIRKVTLTPPVSDAALPGLSA